MLTDLPNRHADVLLEYFDLSIVNLLKIANINQSSCTVIPHVLGVWVSRLSYTWLCATQS